MKKMCGAMPVWGPYSKKYSGISRILQHERVGGVRFDLAVSPAVANTDVRMPNVTVPVGCHPWTAKSDYSHYSYRMDLEWKDVIFADVSFTALGEDSVLVRTEITNRSPMMQNCLVNYFAAIEYPGARETVLHLPPKCAYKKALDYDELQFHTPRPWDEQCMDGMKKGEFLDDRFVDRRGLGDRDDNRYILPKFPRFGEEAGDRLVLTLHTEVDFADAVLAIRCRTATERDAAFTLNGERIILPQSDEMQTVFVPVGAVGRGNFTIFLDSLGTGAAELDFFCLLEAADKEKLRTELRDHAFVPQIETETSADGALVSYKYEGIPEKIYLKTFQQNTRFREIRSGCLEDSPTARLSQPHPSFDNMLETFSGSFAEKHSDKGYYHNTAVHTLFVAPDSTHTEYAVISYGKADDTPLDALEKIYRAAASSAEAPEYTAAGKPYAFSNQLLRAAMFTNTVYPLYKQGEFVVHHTPGKRWDSFYTWDSGFIGLDMLEFAPALSYSVLDMYLSTPDNKDFAFLLHGSPVPVHLYQYYEMLNRTNDKEKLFGLYDRAKLFYDFLAGKIHKSTTARFQSGLTTTFDYFYNCSGMDDLPPQVAMYARGLQRNTAPVISTSQVIRTAKLLSVVAAHIGRDEDVKTYKADIDRLTDALRRYAWDEDCGYFSYVVHDENGKPKEQLRTSDGENLNKTIDGLYPLIAGAVTEKQKTRLLAHLKNDAELFTPVGISAVDRSAGYYAENGYWNGNVWFSHQWFIWKTMLDLGETDFAYKIAETALNAWKKEVEYSYYTFEMLNIKTGRGGWFHNFGGLSAPINLWAAAYFTTGRLTCGFDAFCEKADWNENHTELHAVLSVYAEGKTAILAVMDDTKPYKVSVHGADFEAFERFPGLFEITLTKAEAQVEIDIQPV